MNAQLGRVVAPIAVGVFATVALLSKDVSAARLLSWLVVVTLAVLSATFRATGWVLIGGLALAAGGLAVLCHAQPANLGWFGLCVLVGWAALATDLPRAAVLTAVTLVLLALEMVNKPTEPGWISWAAGCLFTFVACYFARRQALLLQQLREAQSALAEQARLGERARIAGELHDVVGHSMTVALMHIESARLALDDSRDEAQSALTQAERVARRGLDEVRAAVGVMRASGPDAADPPMAEAPGGDPRARAVHSARGQGAQSVSVQSPLAPLPDATALGELVRGLRAAGVELSCTVVGNLAALGSTRGLAFYRIAQEALTNAARHGGAGPVELSVRIDDAAARLQLVNPLPVSFRPGAAGQGLANMAERAASVGGSVAAGPVERVTTGTAPTAGVAVPAAPAAPAAPAVPAVHAAPTGTGRTAGGAAPTAGSAAPVRQAGDGPGHRTDPGAERVWRVTAVLPR